MEDIDLELKKVQLARERLALEKETARRNLKAKTVGQLASAGSAGGLVLRRRAAAGGLFAW